MDFLFYFIYLESFFEFLLINFISWENGVFYKNIILMIYEVELVFKGLLYGVYVCLFGYYM